MVKFFVLLLVMVFILLVYVAGTNLLLQNIKMQLLVFLLIIFLKTKRRIYGLQQMGKVLYPFLKMGKYVNIFVRMTMHGIPLPVFAKMKTGVFTQGQRTKVCSFLTRTRTDLCLFLLKKSITYLLIFFIMQIVTNYTLGPKDMV